MASSDDIFTLSDDDLDAVASALLSGRLAISSTRAALIHLLGERDGACAAAGLAQWAARGFTEEQTGWVLNRVVDSRRAAQQSDDKIGLVLTGPESPGIPTRDTAAVVHELFMGAQSSVLVAGYAIHEGQRVFSALASRLDGSVDLDVRMYFDALPQIRDATGGAEADVLFAERFRTRDWPRDHRLPKVFCYVPEIGPEAIRSSMHAKCIVIDRAKAFISSANFTNAAQERNVEVGVLLRIPHIAERLVMHFEALSGTGRFRRVI